MLRGLLAARLPNEDIIGDLAELDHYNTRVERAKSLRRSGFQGLLTQQDLLAAASVRWAGYRVLRAEEDERLVSALLDDPLRLLGEDPFPAKVDGQDVAQDRWRSPLDAPGAPLLSREQLAVTLTQSFLTRLPDKFPDSESTEGRVVAFGALPLLRITQLLIEWAQYLEESSREAGGHKKKLYRVAAFVREAIDRPRRLGWVTLAATVPAGKNEQDLRAAAGVLADLMLVSSEEASRVCTALNAVEEDRDVLKSAVQARLRALDSIPGRAWGSQTAKKPNDTDLRLAILRDVLVPIAQSLQTLTPQDDTQDNDETRQTYPAAAYLDRVLDGEIGCAALEALEVVAYPEFAAGLPGRRPVKFRRLSAANPTPLAPKFTALLAAAKQRGAWWDPEQTDDNKQQGIHVSLKLAGNELANFAAFLCEEWRLNDWMWGRLDAVPTMVDLLLASDRFHRGPEANADEARVQELVIGPPERPSPLRDFLLAEVLSGETVKAAINELATPAGPMPVLRQALIAARQWEILAEEMAVPPPGLVDRVAAYNTGAQTIQSPEVRDAIRTRLDAITHVVDDVAIYCAQLQFSNGPLGTPSNTTFTGGALRKAIEFLGSLAAKRLTDD